MAGIPAWAWVTWIAVTLATFLTLEIVALVSRHRGDTLSENLRRWLGIEPAQAWRRWGIAGFLVVLFGFTLWFGPHIVVAV